VNDVAAVLDAWHSAAATASESAYFDRFAPEGVFFGTDSTERWSREEFHRWAKPYFERGKAWTFKPHDRHIYLSARGDVAWFDEMLDSASYGLCRGTGVLQWRDDGWKIEQYHLTIPIPNDLSDEVVAKIRGMKK
jgi:hypothetical protein